jgi:ABC-type transport system involved in cytochrome c biogenesis permease component
VSALGHQLVITLRLHFRNKMALIYSYLFPTIFLVAFWMLYRYDKVPLARHLGELLTVTILGGACFGLPTSFVSERERGVWRRYRMAPVSPFSLIGSTIVARYLLLIVAGLLQVLLAMAIGMPLPGHPVGLWLAFTCVAFAFLGLGLVIAMLADNVPAVQALGQCIFLPMLIIGGIAVPLASLPDWAQRVATFFPGRYAVDALQACVTGAGLGAAGFSVLALLMIGAAGCLAGAKMFRWDAAQRFATSGGRGWLALALSSWVAVGLLAQSTGRLASSAPAPTAEARRVRSPSADTIAPTEAERAAVATTTSTSAAGQPAPVTARPSSSMVPPAATAGSRAPGRASAAAAGAATSTPARPATGPPPDRPAPASSPAPPPADTTGPTSWQAVTLKDIEDDLIFDRLPPDGGVVTPVADADEVAGEDYINELEFIRTNLPQWAPGKVQDPVQRVRNYLLVAAVPDLYQSPMERFIPSIVFDRIREDVPKDQLIQVLYWIALHRYDGDDTAADQLRVLGLGNGPRDMVEARERAAVYAVKLLGRVLGKIKADGNDGLLGVDDRQ